MFTTWFPALASYYDRLRDELHENGWIERDIFPALQFAAHTLNLGPLTACFWHRDKYNLSFGMCAVCPFGRFDHTRSGHLLLAQPKLMIELRPGDVILFPSAVVTHANLPLQPGDLRMSWVMYSTLR